MEKINLGRRGEECAINYLSSQGYQIIARNFRIGKKELDIIARKKSVFYFFEIKTRCSSKTATTDTLVNQRQIINLKKAALSYAVNLMLPIEKIHFDLIVVCADLKNNQAQLKHYRNIF